jgi:hypothetical protein
MTSASVAVVTMSRSSLSIYIFFVHNNFFLIACFVNSSLEVTFRISYVYNTIYMHADAFSVFVNVIPYLIIKGKKIYNHSLPLKNVCSHMELVFLTLSTHIKKDFNSC